MRKKLILAVCLMTLASSAFAWVWFVQGAQWAMTAINASRVAFATNAGLRAATAKSLSVHATVGGIMLATSAAIYTEPTKKVPAHVMIDLSTLPKRQNPDPKRYNDAPDGQVDPVPKSSYDAFSELPVFPSTWDAVVADMSSPAFKLYRNSTNTQLHYVVTQDYEIGYRPGAIGTSTSAIPNTLPDDPKYVRGANVKKTTVSCGGASESSPNCVYTSAYRYATATSCPEGYVQSGTLCNLQDATLVKKPEKTVPCEVVQVDGVYQMDWANPECNTVSTSGHIRTINSSTVELDNEVETLTTSCGSAGCEMVYKDKTDNSWIKYTTGPTDPATGHREVTAIQNGTGTAPVPTNPGNGSGGGDTGGGDTGGGDTGSLCVEGQPCYVQVDDSGFEGKDTGLESLETEEQAHFDQMMEKAEAVRFDDTHGLEWDWIPELPDATCSPVRYGIDQHFIELDLCDKFQIVRDVLAWILYIYTGMYVLNLFLASAYPSYHTSKMPGGRR